MEPLDDQARALIDQLRAHGFRPAHQVPVEESRHGLTAMALQMAGPKVQVQAVDERTIPGPGGPLPASGSWPRPRPCTGSSPAGAGPPHERGGSWHGHDGDAGCKGASRVIFVQYATVGCGLTCIVRSRALGAKAVRVDRC